MPYFYEGIGRQVVMVVNKAVRTGLGKEAGEFVQFVLMRDRRSRSAEVIVPPELAEALARDEAARVAFDGLAPSHRREYAEFVGQARREETRRRRAEGTVGRLRQG
jgi:hypothetical protein